MQTEINFTQKENFVTMANAIVNSYKVLKSAWQTILDLLYKENGKTLNRRFTTKLATLLDPKEVSVSINNTYFDTEINIFLVNRNFCDSYGKAIYIDNKIYYRTLAKKYLTDVDGKINADYAAESIQRIIANIDKSIAKYEDAVQNFDTYTNKVNTALENLKSALRGVNEFFLPVSIERYDLWNREDINNS